MNKIQYANIIASDIYKLYHDSLAMKYYDSNMDHRKLISSVIIDNDTSSEYGLYSIQTPMETYEISWWKYIVIQYIINFRKNVFLNFLKQNSLGNFPNDYLVWFQTPPSEYEINKFAIEALTHHILKFI
jgi:hypothetical protein